MNSPQLLSPSKKVKCNGCGVLLDDKYMLPSHIKRVHMKVGMTRVSDLRTLDSDSFSKNLSDES